MKIFIAYCPKCGGKIWYNDDTEEYEFDTNVDCLCTVPEQFKGKYKEE